MFDDLIRSYEMFQAAGVDDPLFETLRLVDLLSAGALRRTDIPRDGATDAIDLAHLAGQRKAGVPMEYILGQAVFMGYTFRCGPETLIPTEETQLLVNTALQHIQRQQEKGQDEPLVVDIGTGCGNIAICLALGSESANIIASDVSPDAAGVAQENVDRFSLQNRIHVLCGDLFAPIQELTPSVMADVVVCNPPYIPTGSLEGLPKEVIEHEPRLALDAGPYGINIFRRLIGEAPAVLKVGGVLVFEIGAGQEKLVTRLLERGDTYRDIDHVALDSEIRVVSAMRAN